MQPKRKSTRSTKNVTTSASSQPFSQSVFLSCFYSNWHYYLAILQAVFYSYYLLTCHENELWFSNISELEREISFRTEQGLYYNNFKILVDNSIDPNTYERNTFLNNIKKLLKDTKTEYPHEVNLFQRFNIFPELILADIWRFVIQGFKLADLIFKYQLELYLPVNVVQFFTQPIIFYTYSIFLLQGLQSLSIFLICNYLNKNENKLSSVLAQFSFFGNLYDNTRVYNTVPLRESFALPILFFQIYLLNLLLNKKEGEQIKTKNHSIKSLADRPWNQLQSYFFFTTLVFSLCWQFKGAL